MNSIAAKTFPAYRSNVAICPAGERGGKLLPKLLKPGELASKEQKEVFRKENGIEGLGDIGRLIEVTVSPFIDRLPFLCPWALLQRLLAASTVHHGKDKVMMYHRKLATPYYSAGPA